MGKFSAHADDVANFIPARLSIPLIFAGSLVTGMDYKKVVMVSLKDRLSHPSPNSGHPEAAFAGALGVQLGGTSRYGGIESNKPLIGEPLKEISTEDIKKAVLLLVASSMLSLIFLVFISLAIRSIFL